MLEGKLHCDQIKWKEVRLVNRDSFINVFGYGEEEDYISGQTEIDERYFVFRERC